MTEETTYDIWTGKIASKTDRVTVKNDPYQEFEFHRGGDPEMSSKFRAFQPLEVEAANKLVVGETFTVRLKKSPMKNDPTKFFRNIVGFGSPDEETDPAPPPQPTQQPTQQPPQPPQAPTPPVVRQSGVNKSIHATERQTCLKESRFTAEWMLPHSSTAALTAAQMRIEYLRRVNMAFHQYERLLSGEAQSLLGELMKPPEDEGGVDDLYG